MLQFFEWFWKAIGLTEKLQLAEGTSFQGFVNYGWKKLITGGQETAAILLYIGGIILLIAIPYLLGSLNGAILVSRNKYGDDIRNHGSGNAGLTNMGRVFGKDAAILTFVIDFAKQFLSVIFGVVVWGEIGAYLAGIFCMIGHIVPIYFHFRGGKGVLTAGVMILLIDYQVFLIAILVFGITLLLTRYVSVSSMIAGFALPGIVYTSAIIRGTYPHPFALFFAVMIGLMLILMHRSNIKRLYEGTEPKIHFGKKKSK